MHQDVFICNRDFLKNIVDIFQTNEKVGMIGMVGGVGMPKTGVAYLAWNEGIVDCREPDLAYHLICGESKQDVLVDAIDGLLMATQYDVSWREDLFENFDFYDVSQSFEMKRAGYDIVVPYQKEPWVIHDSSFAKLNNYDKNRQICLQEYPEYFTEDDGFAFVYQQEWEDLSDALANMVQGLIAKGDWQQVKSVIDEYHKNEMKNSKLEMYGIMAELQMKSGFFDNAEGYDAVYEKYITLRFLLRRIEMDMPKEEYAKILENILREKNVVDVCIYMIIYGVMDKKNVLQKLMEAFKQEGMEKSIVKLQQMYQSVKNKPVLRAYSKRRQQ